MLFLHRRLLFLCWSRLPFLKAGAWTCSIGNRGMRVRLFQKRSGGTLRNSVLAGRSGPRRGEKDFAGAE